METPVPSAPTEHITTFFGQAHCELCFTNVGKLSPCKSCSTICYCEACLPNAPATHASCDESFLMLACYSMIGHSKAPFSQSSESVVSQAQAASPVSSWTEYLEIKRGDFELPQEMFNIAPVVAMMTERLSLQLTTLHALHTVYKDSLLSKNSLTITMLGASGSELGPNPRDIFRELLNWLPTCRHLKIRLIGPGIVIPIYGHVGPYIFESLPTKDGRKTVIEETVGLYHNVVKVVDDDTTDMYVLQHSRISCPDYTDSWMKTLVRVKESGVPALFTGYSEGEMELDGKVLAALGFNVITSVPNKLRGLRPELESCASTEGLKVYYGNAFLILTKGV